MAAFSLRAEVTCSACREIYTDPVTLPCGHNFCLCCIGRHWDWQKGIEEDPSCPECMKTYRRRPELNRNLTLRNIAERFRPTDPEQECSGIFCTYCDSPVPAAKSCLHCEASLCDYHVREHSRAAEHVLTDPTASFGHRKCSEHMELLRYHCTEDGACICATGLQSGEHKEHKVETVNEASKKKKEKLWNILLQLSLSRREAEIRAQRLQECSRDVAQKAADETERVTALFRVIGERLEALEKRLLRDISWEQEKVSLQLNDLIQQLEIKKDELSGKIRHIEELCNMGDPLTVLRASESAFSEAEWGDYEERHLDREIISDTLLSGLAVIVTGMKEWWLYGQRAMDLVLDTNTAANDVLISPDLKTASFSKAKLYWPKTSARFGKSQALGCRGFSSGRRYWDVEGCGEWAVGVAYASIERHGSHSWIGFNDKSWGLCVWDSRYSVRHNNDVTDIAHGPSPGRIRISLDCEMGLLSFYELSEPIRHLHTFSASFTEPLHAAFWVGMADAWVRIIS
ncbi:hypothetical protein XENTR_v10022813 [Xenopus tropicalis]|uniref:E3 ubiquitin-protein ligase Midline-1 n=1 Tax=Xenopus tropicalis TaxID=8364 RepID=A0A1B8Y1S5_XENTR|nr:E3 ubiquitin-protein ligase Midline-1 [Xenopus tropicalis]KAE8588925.1 hypothetical protein XENTR_v10022813 [Xenopus tropicalis]|eukprot:XP_002942860.1 PREDICTED: E3 ubiquitin-protein ligase Midline-1-like [Xenopus tropicalis]